MAKIDLYLNSISRFGAQAALLSSGGNVTLRFPTGDRYASQTTTHEDLVALVQEISTRPVGAGTTVIPYHFNGKPFTVRVETVGKTWKVLIEPGEAPAPAPAAPAPAAASPASAASKPAARTGGGDGGLEIERHSYGSVERPGSGKRPATGGGTGPQRAIRADTPPSGVPAAAAAPAPAAPAPVADAPSGRVPFVASSGGGPKTIEKLLLRMKELGASDLHMSSENPPMLRLHGEMKAIDGQPSYGPDELLRILYEIAPEKNRKEFEERNDTDFAHAIPGVARFRVNMFRDRKGPGAVFRQIPFTILTPEQLGLPKGVLDLCHLTKGLVVVTGPTGSGKSTTLATLIDYINRNRSDHIITIEDPIEFVHENKKCLVNQREVHSHTRSFKDALRAALREDPDIVLVGEMRDLETIAIAVETAETSHLVFGTLHTTTAPSTIDRIIDQFPPDRQEQIRQMLAESLKGVIAQVLCKKIGGGRVAAYEILLGSSAVSNLIREKKTFQLFSLMQTGRAQGMITLNDSLLDLVKRGVIEPMEAYRKAVNKAEFKNLLARENIKLGFEA